MYVLAYLTVMITSTSRLQTGRITIQQRKTPNLLLTDERKGRRGKTTRSELGHGMRQRRRRRFCIDS